MILSGDVQMSENGKRRSYDRVFKVEEVRLVTKERRRVTEVARNLGIKANQLRCWIACRVLSAAWRWLMISVSRIRERVYVWEGA